MEMAEMMARDNFPGEAFEVLMKTEPAVLEAAARSGESLGAFLFAASKYALAAGRLRDAEQAVERARSFEPSHPSIAYLQAVVLARQGREEDAARSLSEAIRLSRGGLRAQAEQDPVFAALDADSPVRRVLAAAAAADAARGS
jgi:Flp pilus assembly protein TadD